MYSNNNNLKVFLNKFIVFGLSQTKYKKVYTNLKHFTVLKHVICPIILHITGNRKVLPVVQEHPNLNLL